MSDRSEGIKRREKLLSILQESETARSGSALAEELGVSRQVIVQDIALLRAQHADILSTARGYRILQEQDTNCYARYCVRHTKEQIQDELNIIVDNGAAVLDVSVEHSVYGEIRADLYLESRRDVKGFVQKISQAESVPLYEIGKGVHCHWVRADEPAILDEIELALKEVGYLISRKV